MPIPASIRAAEGGLGPLTELLTFASGFRSFAG
jgi:hypothetical protein